MRHSVVRTYVCGSDDVICSAVSMYEVLGCVVCVPGPIPPSCLHLNVYVCTSLYYYGDVIVYIKLSP